MVADSPQRARHRRWRTVGRWAVLAVAVGLAWPWRPEAWFGTSLVLPSLSPLVAIGGALGARSASWWAALALPVLVLAWFVRRAICRYGCPVGLLQETIARLRPARRPSWLRLPALGPALAVTTLTGAAFGYPLLLWLDPFAIFNGALNAWRQPLTWMGIAAGLGLPALLLLELAWPRLWCRRLCPLGGAQDLLVQVRRRLTGRPRTVAPIGASADSRRTFFAACAGAAGAVALQKMRGQTPALRPPGAVDESRFPGVCVRCGNCAQACPAHIIQPDLSGLAGLLTPRLSFAQDYCREECRRCLQVCPSGALTRLSPGEKRRAVIGRVRFDLDTCWLALGRECTACVQRCPFRAITIATAADGFSSEPRLDAARCNGCGACEAVCPVRPARAAVVATASRPMM